MTHDRRELPKVTHASRSPPDTPTPCQGPSCSTPGVPEMSVSSSAVDPQRATHPTLARALRGGASRTSSLVIG